MKIHKFISLAVLGILLLNLSVLAGAQDPLEEIKLKIEIAACWILSILVVIVGLVAALFIVLSGIKWMTSEDLAERNEAKNRIMWAIIGFLVVILACPFAEFLAFEPLQSGFCGRCGDITGVPLGPTPPGWVPPGGIPGGAFKVSLTVKPNPTDAVPATVTFTCTTAHAGISSGEIDFGDGAKEPIDPDTPKEHEYSAAGVYIAKCTLKDDGKLGWAQQMIIVGGDESNLVAMIVSIGGENWIELNDEPPVDINQDSSGDIRFVGDASGGSGVYSFEWREGATVLKTGKSVDISLAPGLHTITLRVKDDGKTDDSDSIQINVIEYTYGKCHGPEDCDAYDTDGGDNPWERGICYDMDCIGGDCKKSGIPSDDSCSGYNLYVSEWHPSDTPKYVCTSDPINCYDKCPSRGGICENGACKCLGDNCLMKPKDEGTGKIILEDGKCWVEGEGVVSGPNAGFDVDRVDYDYVSCGSSPPDLSAAYGGKSQSKNYCAEKCRITLKTYGTTPSDYHYSVCIEEVAVIPTTTTTTSTSTTSTSTTSTTTTTTLPLCPDRHNRDDCLNQNPGQCFWDYFLKKCESCGTVSVCDDYFIRDLSGTWEMCFDDGCRVASGGPGKCYVKRGTIIHICRDCNEITNCGDYRSPSCARDPCEVGPCKLMSVVPFDCIPA